MKEQVASIGVGNDHDAPPLALRSTRPSDVLMYAVVAVGMTTDVRLLLLSGRYMSLHDE